MIFFFIFDCRIKILKKIKNNFMTLNLFFFYFLSHEFFLQLNSKHLGQPVKMVSLLNFLNHT